jgi:cysteinyl-tRNA synthetase
MKLYNSLNKKINDFNPINPNEITMYSCGPTVYSYAHIGNMRAFLFADLLQRVLRIAAKYNVKWVMNITNIDDKTIRDSKLGSENWNNKIGKQTGDPMKDLLALTQFYQNEFITDIEKLGIEQKDFFAMPKATDYISEMQELITNLLTNDLAYVAGDSIYFNVAKYRQHDKYGKLFKIDFEHFQAGLRVDTDQYEREQVSDFVVWKGRKEGEPYWDFYVNDVNYPGRPGWHTECSAMTHKLLGLPFDIHTGGIDLKFPHHEDEIAQSKAAYGVEPVHFWCHNEFLEVEGSKMSKSLGNFFTLRSLEEQGIEPVDVRYAMLSVHYRTKYNFTMSGITASRKARLRVQEYIWQLLSRNVDIKHNDIDEYPLKNEIYAELTDDLHTPKALAHLFTFINNNPAETLNDNEATNFISLMLELNDIFRAWSFEPKPLEDSIAIPTDITALADKRLAAKKAKDFAEADRLRNEITQAGWMIKDTKDGYELEKAE